MLSDPRDRVSIDLVAYCIVTVPTVDSVAVLAPAMTELVQRAAIRILDVVVLVKDVDGAITTLELDAVDGMGAVRHLQGYIGGMLSDRDLTLASTALRPGSAGAILVTEDRWAESLAVAAQRVGGHIIAGERIPAIRVQSALAERTDDDEIGG